MTKKTRMLYIVLTFRIKKEDDRWVGSCDELGTAISGRTIPETHKKLVDMVSLHLNTLEEVGERERFFKENGIEVFTKEPKKPIPVQTPISDDVYIQSHLEPIPV